MIDDEIEPTPNKRLLLVRYMQAHMEDDSGMVFLTPSYLYDKFKIDVMTIDHVLAFLEHRSLIDIIVRPNPILTQAQRNRRDDEQDYYQIQALKGFTDYFGALEKTADFYGAEQVINELPPISSRQAVLTFKDMATPIVSVGPNKYVLRQMYDSAPLQIITFCMTRHPSEAIPLGQLKDEMKAANTPLHGVDQLTTALRKSHFAKDGPLRPFVSVSPKSIIVNKTAYLEEADISAIRQASL